MRSSIIFAGLFIAVSVVHLVAVVLDGSMTVAITKPFIMITLTTYFLVSSPKPLPVFVTALVFCWAGDVLLLFSKENPLFFMLGLAAFLIGHVAYIISYRQLQWADKSRELLPTQKIRFSLPVILVGTGLTTILFPYLGGLKIPVVLYAAVITLMVMTAIFRFGRTSPSGFWLIFTGAAIFMLSDSLLALNKFYAPIPNGNFFVMTTYVTAQFLIVRGTLAHK